MTFRYVMITVLLLMNIYFSIPISLLYDILGFLLTYCFL